MPFSGTGVFTPAITFHDDTDATAEDQNTQDVDIAGGLTGCMTRAGLSAATGDQQLGGFRIKGLGAGSAPTDAVNLSQISDSNPPGEIILYAGLSIPSGFLFCNGVAVPRAGTYAGLFAAIGTTFGAGDSSTTFNVPDLRGRVAAGADNMGGTPANILPGYNVGTSGGAAAVTLDTTQIPAHTHTDGGHTHGITDPMHTHAPGAGTNFAAFVNVSQEGTFAGGGVTDAGTATGASATGVTVNSGTANLQNTGGGLSHANVQPTLAFNWLIRY